MNTMPKIVTKSEWLTARKQLLEKEKDAAEARCELNALLRALPMMKVDKDYVFETVAEQATLLGLFEGRRQLIVYHFMFHPDRGEGCPGCSYLIDNFGHLAHMRARDTTLALVSRATAEDLERFRRRMGWCIPWYSSLDTSFNYDFHATTDGAITPVEYNNRDKEMLQALGQTCHVQSEQPGISVFLRDGDRVFHTYSTYGRGADLLLTTYNYLYLTPFGRGGGWDGLPNLGNAGLDWTRLHDCYPESTESIAGSIKVSACY